ncbi:hypothetical protein BsIDN1_23320 [Bacillus safensis]|uniref:Uncharacterized protein n=1 Tax=Bacillus safensis TaxID=561879 RepID=A0A5S9M978_BACIA|nr:hypothetical protein BsIDN1_23320 [Bacillus safensis]
MAMIVQALLTACTKRADILPRDASDQAVQGTPVTSSHLEQGDLLFLQMKTERERRSVM